MTAAPTNRTYYPALDGLRGIAILLVLFFHNFGFIRQSFFGWLGVDLFFVLSGFLITDILLRSVQQPQFLRNFYMRRILRIFPLYYLSLIVFLFILPPLTHTHIEWDYFTDNQVYLWTYLQNWLFIFDPSPGADILNHYWSLAVEEQFYIFWPLVILLLRKAKYLLIFISCILLLVIGFRFGLWVLKIENLSYYNLYTFTRIDGICIGCIIALLKQLDSGFIRNNTTVIVLSFAALNFLFYFVNRFYSFSFPYLALIGYSTFAMMLGLLVYEAVNRDTKILNIILGWQILRFFGSISYALYILHWPVYLIFNAYTFPWLKTQMNDWSAKATISIMGTLIAILLSWLSTRYFENYFVRLKSRYN